MMRILVAMTAMAVLLQACGGTSTPTCQNECGPGERRCSGGDSQLCEDTNGDGCLEWGGIEACGTKQCIQGWCVDSCTNQCNQPGEKRCEGNAVKTCGDHNDDGCLEWSSAVPCGGGQACSNGQCGCSDECTTSGEKRCVGEFYQECGNHDTDSCLEWGAEQKCPGSETCSGGQCSGTCTDDCETGDRECSGNGFRVCGHYDADECLDWSGITDCAAHQSCEKGHCVGSCSDECSPANSRRCYQSGFQVCGNSDSDPCLEWGTVTDCKDGETCSNGECSSSCTDECTLVGAKECVSGYPSARWKECGEADDGDDCKDWIRHDCDGDETCRNGDCVDYCVDECTPEDSRRCSGTGYQTCIDDHDSDDCLEWSTITSCSPRTCSNGQCVDTCTNECNTAGERVCDGTTGYRTCGNYDTDPCLDLSNTTQCGTGKVCQGGQCVDNCTNECTVGQRGCSTSHTQEWTCSDNNGDGCLEKVYANCETGETCTTDRCEPVVTECTDDSYENNDAFANATGVGEGTLGGLQVCANDDDYFWIYLLGGETLDVTIQFSHATGDLDLKLYDGGGTYIKGSTTTTDNENLRHVALSAGYFYMHAYGYSGAEAPYTLVVDVEASASCVDDGNEQNDSQAAATIITEGYYSSLMVCANDDDYYQIYLQAGEELDAEIWFTHSQGNLGLKLYDTSGALLQTSDTTWDWEDVHHTATHTGYHFLHVYGNSGAETNYSLDIDVTPATGCTNDSFEDNDSMVDAPTISEGEISNLVLCPEDDDYFRIYAANNETLDVLIDFTHASGDLGLKLYNQTGQLLQDANSSTDDETVSVTEVSGGQYYFVHVYAYGSVENTYDLLTTLSTGTTCNDDTWEDNDNLAQAKMVSEGTTSNLQICSGDHDYFWIQVAEDETITVNIYFTDADGDLELRLMDGGGQQVDSSTSGTDDESVSYTSPDQDFIHIQIYGVGAAENPYSMFIDLEAGATCIDDFYEENDSRAAATYVATNTYSNLRICEGDDDYYRTWMYAGEILDVDLYFTDSLGDIDVELQDPEGGILTYGNSSTDNESISFTADFNGDYFVRVYGIQGIRNDYSMDVTLTTVGPCTEDSQEENDTFGAAKTLLAMIGDTYFPGMQICPGDDDWFRVMMLDGETLTVHIDFTHANGDLDLYVYNATETEIARGTTTTNDETATATGVSAGWNYFKVVGYQGASNGYDITVTIVGAK